MRCCDAAPSPGAPSAAGPLRLRGDNLVQLDLVYLQRVTLGPSDRIEIHVARREKNDRHIKTVGRVRRVDVRLEPLQISVARFFQNELEVAGVPPRSDGLAAVDFEVDGWEAVIPWPLPSQSNLNEPASWLWLPNARKSGSNTARFDTLADALPL